jgi:hypothetical protein
MLALPDDLVTLAVAVGEAVMVPEVALAASGHATDVPTMAQRSRGVRLAAIALKSALAVLVAVPGQLAMS